MGYSARYHAASLAAVFLALAVGILIGVGFGDDVLSGTAENLEQSLEEDLSAAREHEEELAAELERERAFGLQVLPALVDSRLEGETVGVVALGELPESVAGEIEATVEPTAGRLAKVAVVREPPNLDAAAERLGPRFEDVAGEAAARLGRRLGLQLVRGGALPSAVREILLARFSGRQGPVDKVIVYAEPAPEGEAGEETTIERFRRGVLDGISDSGRPVVAVELSGTDPSLVPLFDGHDIPTVDSLDLTSGKLAAVLTLATGAAGNFGIKAEADRLLPELVPPVPVDGEGSEDDQGVGQDRPDSPPGQ